MPHSSNEHLKKNMDYKEPARLWSEEDESDDDMEDDLPMMENEVC